MTKEEAIARLEDQKNERGVANWERMGVKGMSSFGLGLTQIKKVGKEIGKDHELALALWESTNFDVKTLAIIVEEPKKVSREQVEQQVGELHFWMLSHAYCSVMLHKVKFAVELAEEWHQQGDDLKRRCAYLLLYQIAKDNKKLPDSYFGPYLSLIESNIQQEENFVKDAMNTALLMIGQRSAVLHARALSIAQKIGKVEIDYGDNSCQVTDCVMHLSSDRVKKKVGLV